MSGRGRGDSGGRGGARGDFGGRGGGRGDFAGRGRGDFAGRGRGDFAGRGRGDFAGRGGGDFAGRGGGAGGFRGGRGGGGSTGIFRENNVPPPNPEVTKQEDASTKSLSTALAATSLGDNLPRRPGYGTAGRATVLWTNYFDLKGIKADTTYYRYSVAFQGNNELPKPKRKRMIQILLQQEPFSSVVSASDWSQVLITTEKVKLGADRASFSIEWYPSDGEPLPAVSADDPPNRVDARRRNTFVLLVEELGTVSLAELTRDISSSATYSLKLETIQALNIVMSFAPSTDQNIAVSGQNKFYPFQGHAQLESEPLGGGLEALRGYWSSVRTSMSRMLINLNVATAPFYKSGPLIDLFRELGPVPNDDFKYRRLGAFVRKLRFETNYLPVTDDKGKAKMVGGKVVTKRKVHSIFALSGFGKNATNTFFDSADLSGKITKVAVQAHYLKAHKITLANPMAPLVNYGTSDKPKWIPSELCYILPGQLAKRLLQGDQTRAMIAFAARRPFDNAQSIVGNGLAVSKIAPVSNGVNTHLEKFGLKVDPNLITVHGRILPPPLLQYRGTSTCRPNNGAWNLDPRSLGQKPFRLVKPLPSWVSLIINSGNYETVRGGPDAATELMRQFRSTLDQYGLQPGPVQRPAIISIAPGDLASRNIAKLQAQIKAGLIAASPGGPPKFALVILPNDNAVLYDSIKHLCDVQLGIPTVCSIGQKITKEKGQPQYFANVVMKFNQKLGGINHTVEAQSFKPLDPQTIVFGIDVTHPSPGSAESSPSIAGVVASADAAFSQYPGSIRTQKGRQEMVEELEEMIIERLKLWQKRNQGRLPLKVIVYRDGVSEGQYRIVLEQEYPSFVAAFTKLYGAAAKHPKISIIIVGKRHHTRFYPTKSADSDVKTGNAQPGTVVDRGVTGEKLFDFFLLAHQGLQGTSKPAHYVVIKDENKLGADELQKLTHNLCYTFARATRSVSICPPAYYADILCERGRAYLQAVLKGDGATEFSTKEWQKGVHANLVETMFYL